MSRTCPLKRIVEIEREHCPNFDGQLKFIAAIQEQPVIEKILMHLGQQDCPVPRSPCEPGPRPAQPE
jgi:hypothetical protein